MQIRTGAGENGTKRDERAAARAGGLQERRASADQVLTSREARALLKIGRTKLHELTQRQLIPAYRIGTGRTSSLRYLRSDLLGWLVRQKI